MKTLEKHTLIYDEDCPLCNAYTGAFIKHKWLDSEGRSSYQQVSQDLECRIDMQRSRSEVALIDKQTNQVFYGIDAMMRVIGNKIPLLQPLFRQRWFYWFMKRVYFFISYNRKVIAAVKPSHTAARGCTPAFSFEYRLAYLLFGWLFTLWIWTIYARSLKTIIPQVSAASLLWIFAGQIALQGILMGISRPKKTMEYLGNVTTVSLIGSLLLLPAGLLANLFSIHAPIVFACYLWLVIVFISWEHLRRIQLLKLSPFLAVTWLYYWLVAFMFCG